MGVVQMRNVEDAAQKIREKLGDISELVVGNDRVLVAVFIHEGMTKGGILTGVGTQNEAKYQGKVCLVLKCGPCVNPEGKERVRGFAINEGDWIVTNASDGLSMNIGAHRNDVPIRMLVESVIHMKIPRPDLVW